MNTLLEVFKLLPLGSLVFSSLQRYGFTPSEDIVFSEAINLRSAKKLVAEIVNLADVQVSSNIRIAYEKLIFFEHPKTKSMIWEQITGKDDVQEAMELCCGSVEQGLWLMEYEPEIFDKVYGLLEVASHDIACKTFLINVHKPVRQEKKYQNAFIAEVCTFYKMHMGAGGVATLNVSQRINGDYYVALQIKDSPQTSEEFDKDAVCVRVVTACRPATLIYTPSTGQVQVYIEGGAKYRLMFARAFVNHLLGEQVDPVELPNKAVNFDGLVYQFFSPKAQADGFEKFQVKSAQVESHKNQLLLNLNLPKGNTQSNVFDLATSFLGEKDSIRNEYTVKTVELKFFYKKGSRFMGKHSAIRIKISNDGGIYWSKYQPEIREKITDYLVDATVIQDMSKVRSLDDAYWNR